MAFFRLHGLGRPTPYVGPGDAVFNQQAPFHATAWGGLRAYNKAAVGAKAIRLIRASDSVQQDFVTLRNGELDYASINAFLAATTGKVVTLYDQTSHNFHLTQATDANRPVYNPNGPNGKAQIDFTAASSMRLAYAVGYTQNLPATAVVVAKHTTSATKQCILDIGGAWLTGFRDSADNQAFMSTTATLTGTAADGSFNVLQADFDGGTSDMRANATTNSGDTGLGEPAGAAGISVGATTGGSQFFGGSLLEIGFWLTSFVDGQKTDMDANISSYYGI